MPYDRVMTPQRRELMKGYRRKYDLKRQYDMTVDDYNTMFTQQNGVCILCGNPPREGKALGVDHCHTTGRVRGLLCDICNRKIIGKRDLAFFERCVEYMREPLVKEVHG